MSVSLQEKEYAHSAHWVAGWLRSATAVGSPAGMLLTGAVSAGLVAAQQRWAGNPAAD